MIAEPTGTDGLRTIGRTCHLSLLQSYSQAEMIFLSTATQPLLRLMSNDAQVQTPTGKYPLESGLVFFIALTRANHSEKLQGIITFPMKQYAVLFGQLVKQNKWAKCYL